ncbi:MAG TPA: hypothetical protein VMD29_02785, partial [Terracidiphilus sp.]|nr:hypothetical protein [Terracidiphilus sp.]
MIPASSFLISLADAAARSLLLAVAVGAGLWALRVRNVVAQKAAWILVLAASFAMPLVARWAAHASLLPDRDTFVVTGGVWHSTTSRVDAPPVAISASTFIERETESATGGASTRDEVRCQTPPVTTKVSLSGSSEAWAAQRATRGMARLAARTRIHAAFCATTLRT